MKRKSILEISMLRALALGAALSGAATCLASPQNTSTKQPVPQMFDVNSLAAPDASARIASTQPKVAARYEGRTALVTLTDGQAPAAEVARLALIGFASCDDALKLFVTPDLRQGIEQNESYIRLDFSGAVSTKSVSGTASTSIQSMLVPLTGRWAKGSQTFFYAGGDGRWSALRWNKLDPATWQALLGAVEKMVR